MHTAKLVAMAIVGAPLAACAADPSASKEGAGTAFGAITGAVIGSQFGGGPGERLAAGLAGAAIGGLIGNRIGAEMDEEDRRRAYEAHMRALEAGRDGVAVEWRNQNTGRYGTVVPGPPYQTAGGRCRTYTQTIYIDGRPQVFKGTACRNPDGTWTALG
ncbi:MAG: RT0821/Lpp0805 family surface protein [Xanthobacteraceae bacterium]